jgi:flavodoxin
MMKVLIAYDSRKGHTEKMAQFMAEGARFAGAEVEVQKITEIKGVGYFSRSRSTGA